MTSLTNESAGSKKTLDNEVKAFASSLQYWAKFIADKILNGIEISDEIIEESYSYLLEEIKINPPMEKEQILIKYNPEESSSYKKDLKFKNLSEVTGVNALIENESIDFGPNLTLIFGSNGSGKSGYVRLLKKVFYSKAPEEILKNVKKESGHNPLSAKFKFQTDDKELVYSYPENENQPEYDQFSVFDCQCILKHLDQRNEFEFRPAGLRFFAVFTDAIKRVEHKLNTDIATKATSNDFASLFDGDSEIKTLIQKLSSSTDTSILKKYFPLSPEEISEKKRVEKEYDELLLSSRGKEKEIKTNETIIKLLRDNKKEIETLNTFFTDHKLKEINSAISDCVEKDTIAKKEGIESLKSSTIKEIGSDEWRNFIIAAEEFSAQQKELDAIYPEPGDFCIFCHQPLSNAAIFRILNYWSFLKSQAEQNAKAANEKLQRIITEYEKLKFDLYPDGNILTAWLLDNRPNQLSTIKGNLTTIKSLSSNIITELKNKKSNSHNAFNIPVSEIDQIITKIEESSKLLANNQQSLELAKLASKKTLFLHREKLQLHYAKIEQFINNQKWIQKANSFGWQAFKLIITTTEKRLSTTYFNKDYIDTFNQECKDLHGEFGITIDSKSSEAKSNRQLQIKGLKPSSILSEGEQKVIAIADFLAESKLSEINRGLIFDDPVNSLDENRKSEIADRLVREAGSKQIVIFTHDLVFLSSILSACENSEVAVTCHWIEKQDNNPGKVWIGNCPSYEKAYKKSGKAHDYYTQAQKEGPAEREKSIKNGFAALRTSYESLVIFELFNGVVQRFNERVSVESLREVFVTEEIKNELMDSFSQCCRYMEGHLHSDKYAYKKPTLQNLSEEISRFDQIRKKIIDSKKLK
jgi:energy-coupling factor transporter ATP-binding protein EcfA2